MSMTEDSLTSGRTTLINIWRTSVGHFHLKAFKSAFPGAYKPTNMAVLTSPWADLALFLQGSITMSNRDAGSFFPVWLFGLMLFLSVSLLLLALIILLSWKLRQADADLLKLAQDRRSISATHRHMHRGRHRRNAGSHFCA